MDTWKGNKGFFCVENVKNLLTWQVAWSKNNGFTANCGKNRNSGVSQAFGKENPSHEKWKWESTKMLGQLFEWVFSFSPFGPWIMGIVKMDSGWCRCQTWNFFKEGRHRVNCGAGAWVSIIIIIFFMNAWVSIIIIIIIDKSFIAIFGIWPIIKLLIIFTPLLIS